jgi:hypothetical protein
VRRLVAIVSVTTALVGVERQFVGAAESTRDVACIPVDTELGTTIGTCSGGGSRTVPGSVGRRVQPVDLITAVSETAEGRCTILATPTSQQGQEEIAFRDLLGAVDTVIAPALRTQPLTNFWNRYVGGLPGCPGRSPQQVAFDFIRHVEPLGPDPYIAPGYAITGKLAFLETRALTVDPRPTVATPLGPLFVTLRATKFTVDWGDGSGATGPFDAPGRPWPNGKATHGYTLQDHYDVEVVQYWDATWQLGGARGTIPGLSSVGRIPAFEARQLQAVRNR